MSEQACGHLTRETEEALAWELIDEIAASLFADAEGGVNPYYQLTLDQLDSDIAESTKAMSHNPGFVNSDWALGLHQDCLLREAIQLVTQVAVSAKYPLHPEEPVVYPDGSRSDQVVMTKVDYAMSRYTSGLHVDEVMLEVLSWSQAAQAVFSQLLQEQLN